MLHRSVIALAVGLLALTALHEYHKLATFVHPMRWLAGDESHLAHLKRVGYNRVTGIVQPIAFMNERYDQGLIAASDRALVVAAVPGELLPLPTLPDGTFVGRRWTAELITAGGDLDLLADRLRQRNVRYIILNMGIMMWQGSVHRVERIETLHTLHTLKQFLDRHAAGPPIYAQDYLIIYELRDASSPR
jgi:hypothetical protein